MSCNQPSTHKLHSGAQYPQVLHNSQYQRMFAVSLEVYVTANVYTV